MHDVHPSETASTGRAIRKQAEKPGDLVDRRILCAQCGWPFNPDREVEGDAGGDGNTSGVTNQTVTKTFANTVASLPVQLRDVDTFLAASRDTTDPVVTSGCPFCGTYAPRAPNRNDRSFESSLDVSDS